MTGRLSGKVALITGGASGIGRTTASLFASEGASAVVLVDQDADALAIAGAEVEAAGAVVMTVQADVTDVDRPEATISEVLERFGQLDVVMTAAGISVGRALVDTTPDDWDLVFSVNVKGTYLWLRAGIPPMLEQGKGSVITVAKIDKLPGKQKAQEYRAGVA